MELKIIIPSLLVILGWFVANFMASKRELQSKKRDIRISYLIEAYRAIASSANRGPATSDEQKYSIERAIEDIQLLGNKEQVEALNEMISRKEHDFTKILNLLRKELRGELNLAGIDSSLKFYRMNRS